jgi:hypothetical protein
MSQRCTHTGRPLGPAEFLQTLGRDTLRRLAAQIGPAEFVRTLEHSMLRRLPALASDHVSEYLKRHYTHEEEFLEEFSASAAAAAENLGGEWQPNPHCNDQIRKNQDYLQSTGELARLAFESASVYHDDNGFSSVQIVLRSSTRLATVRAKKVGTDLVTEGIVDGPEAS